MVSEIRLLVGQHSGLHSSSWRIWTHNDSIYLMARTKPGAFKVSVHAPTPEFPKGSCWFGPTRDWFGKNPDGMLPSDKLGRLQRYFPRSCGPGITRIAAVRVDHQAVKLRGQVTKAASHFVLDAPSPGHTVVIDIMLVHNAAQAATWWERDGFVIGIVDESVLGDIWVYARAVPLALPPTWIDSENTAEDKAELIRSMVVIRLDIDPADGAALVDEVPVLQGPPPPGTPLIQ